MRAPPISSSETFSPMTSSAIRGEPRYIEAFFSTMNTTSQNAGMYAPPAALGPNRQQICGMRPDAGDDAVGREVAGERAHQQALFGERVHVVQEQPQTLPDEELSLFGELR